MTIPSLSEVIDEHVAEALGEANFFKPARVDAYDEATSTITATILVPKLISTPKGTRSQDYQPLSNVPLLHLRLGGVSLTVKPNVGDRVTLFFMDRSSDLLWGAGQAGEPGDPRQHDLNDAYALPFFFTLKDVPADADTASIGAESSPGAPGLRIHFTPGALCLGEANPTDAVLLGTTYRAADKAFDDAVSSSVKAFLLASAVYEGILTPLASPAPVPPEATLVYVKALGALLGALGSAASAKEAGASTYLSSSVKVKK